MEPKCPFSAPLTQAEHHCHMAEEVVRRGGSEFNCREIDRQQRCMQLYECLKQAALPAFGVEDDLLSMPHSVLVKIQFGGVLGLQRLLGIQDIPKNEITDLDHLVEQALVHYGNHEGIPCDELTGDMLDYKISRRRRGK